MYKNILICLDGGASDSQILEVGVTLAKQLGAKLHGLTVEDILTLEGPLMYDLSGALAFIPQLNFMEETRKALEERSKNILSGFGEKCEQAGVSYEEVIAQGVVYKTICEKADLNDLVILGRQGLHYQFDNHFLGSTADRVIRHTRTPTLVVAHDFKPFQNPLLAYDASPQAKKALSTAASLCSELKLPLTVLHVGSDAEQTQKLLQEAKEYLDPYSLLVKYENVEGKPHDAIVQYAKKHNHDLLMVGSKGHNVILDFILGSTTQYAVWSGTCHVLVDR